ncbi:MAG: dienelactone hydrolase family protein [Pirellulaceae bacterium]|nr:dienelactone hydrolase family protein [Pirellulaceae bacterium]
MMRSIGTKLDRRTWLAALSAAGAGALLPRSAAANEVPWLAEIQQPPAQSPADKIKLSELLVDAAGQPITTLAGWRARREELHRWWLDFLGPMPAERDAVKPPRLEVLAEDRPEGVIRQHVRYEVEPSLLTEAYVLRPAKAKGKLPGIVALHSTVDYSIRQPAGLEGPPEKMFGLKFARRGCVVICPRCFAWPETGRIAAQVEADKFLRRKPKSKAMVKMLYDALVATDILAALPDVDANRLGAVGHSLGAKETLYLAAFDERIKATVSSEGGIGTRFSNWEAPWYLGPTIKEPAFTHEHHELLALAAPRPFLLIGGESADGDRGWPFIEAALPVYRLYGEPARLGQFNHRQGHAVPKIAEERIEEWLLTYL